MSTTESSIELLAKDPYTIDFTTLDVPTRNALLRKIYEPYTVKLVFIPTYIFGAILRAHYPSIRKIKGYGNRDTIRLGVNHYDEYGIKSVEVEFKISDLEMYEFIITDVTYTHNLIDKAGYKIIKSMLKTGDKYWESGRNKDGNTISGPLESYPSLDAFTDTSTRDHKLFRDFIYINESRLIALKDTHRLDWLRTLYPKLVSPPIALSQSCTDEYQERRPKPIIENTLYEKILYYLANNMHLVNFTKLPHEVSDALLKMFVKCSKRINIKGYLLHEHVFLDFLAMEYGILPKNVTSDKTGQKIKKDGVVLTYRRPFIFPRNSVISTSSIINIHQFNGANAYNNRIIREIYNLNLYSNKSLIIDLDNRMFETEESSEQHIHYANAERIYHDRIIFIKSSPQSDLLYQKYKRVCNMRMISDLVDMPVQLLDDQYL